MILACQSALYVLSLHCRALLPPREKPRVLDPIHLTDYEPGSAGHTYGHTDT